MAGRAQLVVRQVRGTTGDCHGEHRTVVLAARYRRGATVNCRELADEREPDTGALVCPGAVLLHAVEALEHARQLRRRNADAGVGHPQNGVPVLPRERDSNLALERELQGVGEQVEDDLFPHVAIDMDRLGQRRTLHHELEARLVGRGAKHAGEVGGERRQVGGLEAGIHAPRLEAREIEQRVHELEQPKAVAMRGRQRVNRFTRQSPGRVAQQLLERTEHQRERRAELVRHV